MSTSGILYLLLDAVERKTLRSSPHMMNDLVKAYIDFIADRLSQLYVKKIPTGQQ